MTTNEYRVSFGSAKNVLVLESMMVAQHYKNTKPNCKLKGELYGM